MLLQSETGTCDCLTENKGDLASLMFLVPPSVMLWKMWNSPTAIIRSHFVDMPREFTLYGTGVPQQVFSGHPWLDHQRRSKLW